MVIPDEILIRQDKNGISLFRTVSCTLRTIIKSDDGESTRAELQVLSGIKFIPIRELKDGNMLSKKSVDQISGQSIIARCILKYFNCHSCSKLKHLLPRSSYSKLLFLILIKRNHLYILVNNDVPRNDTSSTDVVQLAAKFVSRIV